MAKIVILGFPKDNKLYSKDFLDNATPRQKYELALEDSSVMIFEDSNEFFSQLNSNWISSNDELFYMVEM